jgi:steroid 5-alpha reductase family enzyme
MSLFELYGVAALVVFVMVTVLWLVSLPIKDASIIDMLWGPLFVAIAWVLLPVHGGGLHARSYLLVLLVTMWGLRLAFHLVNRNLGNGEDQRYARWRAHGGSNWWLITYYRIFLLQGALALAVATPLIAGFYAPGGLSLVNTGGVLIWAAGFVYELLADVQLARFLAVRDLASTKDPAGQTSLLNTGLWRLSRHPNYFGDALQWWGLGVIAFSAATWWSLIGPLVMTLIFLALTADILERGMAKRHPDYEEYVTQTPKFFPRFARDP